MSSNPACDPDFGIAHTHGVEHDKTIVCDTKPYCTPVPTLTQEDLQEAKRQVLAERQTLAWQSNPTGIFEERAWRLRAERKLELLDKALAKSLAALRGEKK
jgi:hypothetical protein